MAPYEDLEAREQLTQINYVDGEPTSLQLRKIQLVVEPGRSESRRRRFDPDTITIGTNEDNDLVLDDQTVSRRHCRILQRNDRYLVEDLGSTNGTFVDGVRIERAYLEPGSALSIGNTRIDFTPLDEEVAVEPTEDERFGSIVGQSEAMREMFGILDKIAPTSATVVIEGETGTGKEVVARTIHDMGPRSDEDFVVFDCGAVPESLVESELFGHEKGSFTGAVMSRKGLFEVAEGGTIFLDEIGELSPELQPKLLRVLEEEEIRRVGSNEPIPIDVRVVAATNRSLEEEVEAGRFREDLFYRLSVVRLELPPLRERLEDVEPLVSHFLQTREFNLDEEGHPEVTSVASDALEALADYDWPGNVRELVNVVERACSLTDRGRLELEALPGHISGTEALGMASSPPRPEGGEHLQWTNVPRQSRLQEQPFKEAKDEWISAFERDYLAELLVRHDGNITRAAEEAELDRKYFRQLMRDYDLDPEEFG